MYPLCRLHEIQIFPKKPKKKPKLAKKAKIFKKDKKTKKPIFAQKNKICIFWKILTMKHEKQLHATLLTLSIE
jgi:hypothetical protein